MATDIPTPEATEPEFEFEVEGEKFTLPDASSYVGDIPGEVTLNMMMNPGFGSETLLAGAMLRLIRDDHPEAVAALGRLKSGVMLDVITAWVDKGQLPQS